MTVNYIINDALKLCAKTLIPSIFPFMVLTELLLSCGFDRMVKSLIKQPFEAVFHLNANLASAYIIGLISGYPQGAFAIAGIYDRGGCTRKEAEHALAFCNNTGPAFMIAATGSLMGDMRIGWQMFFLQICISSLYAMLTRPKKLYSLPEVNKDTTIGFDVIPKAVTSSVIPMLNICGFVVIFSLLSSLVCRIPVSGELKAFMLSVIEISNAVSYISSELYSLPLLGFALFWAGICVHMQTASAVAERFSMKRYYIGKLIQSGAVFLILYLKNLFF